MRTEDEEGARSEGAKDRGPTSGLGRGRGVGMRRQTDVFSLCMSLYGCRPSAGQRPIRERAACSED